MVSYSKSNMWGVGSKFGKSRYDESYFFLPLQTANARQSYKITDACKLIILSQNISIKNHKKCLWARNLLPTKFNILLIVTVRQRYWI